MERYLTRRKLPLAFPHSCRMGIARSWYWLGYRVVKVGTATFSGTQLRNQQPTPSMMRSKSFIEHNNSSAFSFQWAISTQTGSGSDCLLVWFEDGQVHLWDFLGERINELAYWGLSLEDVRRKQKGTLIVSSWVLYTFRDYQIRPSKSIIGTEGEFELRKCRK